MIVGFAATRPDSSPPRQSLNRPAEITPNQDSAQAPSNDVAPTRLFGWAAGTDSAIIAIDVSAGRATIETRLRDVTYPTCASFHAVSSAGDEIGIGGLLPGDFARVDIDAGAGCLERVALLEPTVPPACDSSEAPGSGVVTWKGFNPRAHSVLYLPSGSTQSVLATRWCESPTVVGADGSATTLARIPLGAQVELLTSSGWVTSITVKS
ncbi:MAG: hypothetical protein QOI61_179 [Actinomycetota bacterium]